MKQPTTIVLQRLSMMSNDSQIYLSLRQTAPMFSYAILLRSKESLTMKELFVWEGFKRQVTAMSV